MLSSELETTIERRTKQNKKKKTKTNKKRSVTYLQTLRPWRKEGHNSVQLRHYFQACEKVVKYVGSHVEPIKLGLDGKNVEATLLEFGVRFHRVVYDHLQQYQYNSMGEYVVLTLLDVRSSCCREVCTSLADAQTKM